MLLPRDKTWATQWVSTNETGYITDESYWLDSNTRVKICYNPQEVYSIRLTLFSNENPDDTALRLPVVTG